MMCPAIGVRSQSRTSGRRRAWPHHFARRGLQNAGTISSVTFLLDVNMLIAAIWEDHADHARVNAWLGGKKTATCPISELGFLRISSGETFVFRAEVETCRKWLADFVQNHH